MRLAFEVGRTSPAFRSLFGTNNGIAGQTIANYGTEEQKQTLPAGAGERRGGRLLRPDRGRGRLGPERDAPPGQA